MITVTQTPVCDCCHTPACLPPYSTSMPFPPLSLMKAFDGLHSCRTFLVGGLVLIFRDLYCQEMPWTRAYSTPFMTCSCLRTHTIQLHRHMHRHGRARRPQGRLEISLTSAGKRGSWHGGDGCEAGITAQSSVHLAHLCQAEMPTLGPVLFQCMVNCYSMMNLPHLASSDEKEENAL